MSGYAMLSSTREQRSNQRTVTFWTRPPERQHRYGVESLLTLPAPDGGFDDYFLASAGRDGSVRLWRGGKSLTDKCRPSDVHVLSLEEHTDWVNDIVSPTGFPVLVSCASDATLKVWDLARGVCTATLVEHRDYVKGLAVVDDTLVASASLDGRVLLWDLERLQAVTESRLDQSSIYCLASTVPRNGVRSAECGARAPVLAAGLSDGTVGLFDSRTAAQEGTLRGHSDIVRCVLLSSNGYLCLSGGSDATVRLWDVRQQRCLLTYRRLHEESVWALEAPESLAWFVSGSRDGSVVRTETRDPNRTCTVLPPVATAAVMNDKAVNGEREARLHDVLAHSVLRLALAPRSASPPHLWVSTAESMLRRIDMTSPPPHKFRVSGHIDGLPSVTEYKVLHNRRHVLTADSNGRVQLWDVCRATCLKQFDAGQTLEQVAAQHDSMVYVPSWFTVDTRLGSLGVRLSKSSVSNAEVYAVDADLEAHSDEQKVNIGEHTLRGLFHWWRKQWLKRQPNAGEEGGVSPDAAAAAGSTRPPSPSAPAATAASSATERRPSNTLPPYLMPGDIPVVVNEVGHVEPLIHKLAHRFDGSDAELALLPSWVVDIVGNGKTYAREQLKVSFSLEPEEGTDIPRLRQSKLSASRILRIRKAQMYVFNKLREQYASGADGSGLSGAVDVPEPADIEIVCAGQALPENMNLGTVRWWLWREARDLELFYRRRRRSPAER